MVASTAVQCQPLHAYRKPISLRDLQHTCASLCAQPRPHQGCGLLRAEGRSPRETYLVNPDHRPKDGKLEQLKPETQRESGISYPTSAWCRRAWHFVAHLPPACSRFFRNSGGKLLGARAVSPCSACRDMGCRVSQT